MDPFRRRIGLPEVDKLLVEDVNVRAVCNPTSTGLKFLNGDKDKEDHISRLPNDILQFIIALLKMREGAATSILSMRWRYLWSTSASCLNFDEPNVLGLYPYELVPEEHERKESLRTDFIKRVNHICHLHCASKIDTLRVSFPFDDDFAGHIDKWMELAAAQGVTKLILDFLPHIPTYMEDPKKYEFPFRIFGSSLKYLDMNTCIIQFPPNFQGVKFLITLKLCKCFLTDKDVQNILSSCDSLQLLTLRRCQFPDLISLKFVGPIQIKHLHIDDCGNVKKIKLQDMNLLSFELVAKATKPKLSIKNVPNLSRLVMNTIAPVEILGNLPRLETLFLRRQKGELPKLSVFKNLKRLVFSDIYLRSNLLVCFLEACPLLRQLELNVLYGGKYLDEQNDKLDGLNSKTSSRVGCLHHNLKEVNLGRFDGHPKLIEFAEYLLEIATVLEKMRIIRIPNDLIKGEHGLYRNRSKFCGMPLEKVCKLLQEKARPTTEILIV